MAAAPCTVHRYHSPHVAGCDVHHILPRSWGGPTVRSNLVTICPSGHRNIHELLAEYVRVKGTPPWDVLEGWGPAERALAAKGWADWQATL